MSNNRVVLEKEWTTEAGLEAKVLIMVEQPGDRKRHRCGYVAVPEGHVLYGIDCSEQIPQITQEVVNNATLGKKSAIILLTASVGADDEDSIRRSLDVLVDVHGGLTFAGQANSSRLPDSSWWFGFDCAHAGDAPIELSEIDRKYGIGQGATVRTLEYCIEECESMAAQLVAISTPKQVENKDD